MGLSNTTRTIGMTDTKSAIEATTGTLAEFLLAYATDTGKLGIYFGGSWHWVADNRELVVDEAGTLMYDENNDLLYEG